jgi:hypothetical protein
VVKVAAVVVNAEARVAVAEATNKVAVHVVAVDN